MGARPWRVVALLALTAAAGAGCALSSREAPSPFEGSGPSARSIRVSVVNNNFNEATIRALYHSERRLGVVPGNGRADFSLQWPSINELRIRIDVLAGDRFVTNRVSVSPGETVYLMIENPVRRSWLRR